MVFDTDEARSPALSLCAAFFKDGNESRAKNYPPRLNAVNG